MNRGTNLVFFVVVAMLMVICFYPRPQHGIYNPEDTHTPEFTMVEPEVDGELLEGNWEYTCDDLGMEYYSWKTYLPFRHLDTVVSTSFTSWDVEYHQSPRFFISTTEPMYQNIWLVVKTDGSLHPEFYGFDTTEPIKDYPGGYEAFETELIEMNIDWEALYSILRRDFLIRYEMGLHECNPATPPPSFLQPSEADIA